MGNKNKHKHQGHDTKMNHQEAKPQDLEKDIPVEDVTPEEIVPEEVVSDGANAEADGIAGDTCADLEKKVEDLQAELDKAKKDYLFLMADFDNFRKRTLKEKSEIIKNAGENVLKGLLPIMDDFERGIKAAEASPEADSVKEGVNLIYNKFKKYLNQNGVKEIDPAEDTFDTEKHEAISAVPVPDEDKKGKIIDTVEKGYTINDKVLRHAKVVVGQ